MQERTALRLASVRFAYRDVPVFEGFDLTVEERAMIAVLGPNGTGKTTLVRLAAGSLSPSAGTVHLFGRDLATLSSRERARKIAVVPQESRMLFDFTVLEVVLMGRGPHLGLLGVEGRKDREVSRAAMEATGIAELAGRPFRALSGGERQRVLIARALAQEPHLLLLDEPTAFLDLRHQLAVYEILTRLREETGLTIFIASHDVNLAARHCGRLVLLRGGSVYADGTPAEVLRPESFRAVYGVEVEIREALPGIPYIVPTAVSATVRNLDTPRPER